MLFYFTKQNSINERGCGCVNMIEEIKEKALQLYHEDWKYNDIAEGYVAKFQKRNKSTR